MLKRLGSLGARLHLGGLPVTSERECFLVRVGCPLVSSVTEFTTRKLVFADLGLSIIKAGKVDEG